MAHSTAAKQAATDAVVDLIDAGTTDANGDLLIKDGATTLSTHALNDPAFGSADSDGIATANAIGNATASSDGTADGWSIQDKDNTEIMSGSAGQKYAITGVSTGAGGSFDIDGDHSTEFSAGTDFGVIGSTGNDGGYTVASVSYDGGTTTTTITVEADQTVSDATVDGYVHVGELGLDNTSINSGQTVSISSMKYRALRS